MDLLEYMNEMNREKESPLASRLRPTTLDEVVGQEHIIGKDKLLYRAIKADKLSSILLYGPPGTGKTTLAKVIAATTKAEFLQINATSAGKKDMEEVVAKAKENRGMYGKKTILFIDEIHRFNKGQQDYLLPFVEDGTIILIGATTENPYFEVNGALISRSIIFELHPLSKENIKALLTRAVTDVEKGLGSYHAEMDEEALSFLAEISGGDARMALNAIELGVLTTPRGDDGKVHITLEVAQECIQKRTIRYDKTGDNHYDTISAFIKSMRGSDPDAAIYYLARMLYAGEEPAFIARRIMICASEDVGIRSGCGSVLSGADALCRRRYPLYRTPHHDLCGGRCVQCRSAGPCRSDGGIAGSHAAWHAGSTDYPCTGGDVCGVRTKEQFGDYGDRRCDGICEGTSRLQNSFLFTRRTL